MSGRRIPAALRALVRKRAGGCCEYCHIHEDEVLAPHEPDHIVAEQHGGATTADNLAFSCYHCNRHKGTNLASVDPATGQSVFLFHPRRDKWTEHFKLDGARIMPLTPSARATAALLNFNARARLEFREILARIRRFPRGS